MPHPSKRKGDAAELEVAKILSGLLGRRVQRMLGAGRAEDVGDLHGLADTTGQVKAYANVTTAIRDGLAALSRQQANAGTRHGVLFVKRPRSGWIAVVTLDEWAALHEAARLAGNGTPPTHNDETTTETEPGNDS